ncbi:MAG: glycosyltransferase family 2 protein [Planctomycetota bacterium]
MGRVPVSLCVITRDEEERIEACLRSVPFADDVVVLDSGSTDRTRERAAALGARVFNEPFRGHVEQKARAVVLAKHDWILALDADESLDEELKRAIPEVLERDGGTLSGYYLPRKTYYLGDWIRYGGWWPEKRLRLFDRRRARWTGSDPHDRVEASGPTADLPGAILHYNYRDITHHLAKVNSYTSIMALRRHEAGEAFRWSALVLHPLFRFCRMYVLRRGFLDGWRGFVLATIAAFYVFLKYAKLWELERHKGEKDRLRR